MRRFLFVFLLSLAAALTPAAKRGVAPEDYFAFENINDARISPDGKQVAQVLTHLKTGITLFQWSPDGKRFVAVTRTGPSDQVEPADRKSDVRHYKHIS